MADARLALVRFRNPCRQTLESLMIEAAGLTKRYGTTLAVDDLSFSVPPGHVTGFLGPNGAGKSTTMRLILGLDAPASGAVTVSGQPYAAYPRPLFQAGALLEAKAFHGGRRARNPPPCPPLRHPLPPPRPPNPPHHPPPFLVPPHPPPPLPR